MTIEEKVLEIMYAKELTHNAKLDRMRRLVPDKVRLMKFADIAKATGQELVQLGVGLKVAEALNDLLKEAIRKRQRAEKESQA
jgi:hypothetical protein